MMQKILDIDAKSNVPQTFEIGSNSDLVLENCVTGNLPWTIETFGQSGCGKLTFPTKFDMVEPLLDLDHQGKTIFRMSVNPNDIIQKIEIGTSPLSNRIHALNKMAEAGYPIGLLIAPVILVENWTTLYRELIEILAAELSPIVLRNGFIEIILMTYSFVQNAINTDAFPLVEPLYNNELMTGRGRGKYCYQNRIRLEVENFLRSEIEQKLKMPILYIS